MLSPNQQPKSDGGQTDNKWEDFMQQEVITPQIGELKTKPSASDFTEKYGERIVYTDENGVETKASLNPWVISEIALAENDPDGTILAGQLFQHMGERWKNDLQNRPQVVKEKPDGNIETSGWENAARVDKDSKLGHYIEKLLAQQESNGN